MSIVIASIHLDNGTTCHGREDKEITWMKTERMEPQIALYADDIVLLISNFKNSILALLNLMSLVMFQDLQKTTQNPLFCYLLQEKLKACFE